MDPRALIPLDVEDEPTPMGIRPFNRWISTGAGGGPYEPRGWYPSTPGNRLAPGYDGIGPQGSQTDIGTARRFVGLAQMREDKRVATAYEIARDAATMRPQSRGPSKVNASYAAPRREPTTTHASQQEYSYQAPASSPLVVMATGQSVSVPRTRRSKKRRYLGDNGEEGMSGFTNIAMVIAVGLGLGLAYITYDETYGTGAQIRKW